VRACEVSEYGEQVLDEHGGLLMWMGGWHEEEIDRLNGKDRHCAFSGVTEDSGVINTMNTFNCNVKSAIT